MTRYSNRNSTWTHLAVALLLAVGIASGAGCAKKGAAAKTDSTSDQGGTRSSDKELAGNQSSLDEQGRVRERSGRKPDTTGETLADDIRFDFNSADLTSESRQTLDEVVRILRERTGWRVVLEGHCDERGTDEYNLALGQRRASGAKTYLKNQGISGKLLDAVSLGENYPADPSHTEEAWAKNRRVHFVFHKPPLTSSKN